jgi:ATP-dependent Clp protease ATP-binding subunit ClpA
MFERYTDRARRVLVLAQEEAVLLGHAEIATGHLLLGLIAEGDGMAGQALESLGITLEGARIGLAHRIVSSRPGTPAGPLPFKTPAKKALELSLREALQLGHNYIGTEHILLGLVREGELAGASVLELTGVSLDGVRAKVIELLRGHAEQRQPVPLEDCRWRAGRRNGRTLYAQRGTEASDDDPMIGAMDTPELARAACRAHNRFAILTDSQNLHEKSAEGRALSVVICSREHECRHSGLCGRHPGRGDQSRS